ncbi:MAG: 30S ribosomal protein S8 [Bacteroidetes bacterium SB0662_bin_6]|nr:30S ribosomal protein S8 [Bacteroidetes bacterium SB0668_bin_1]MYE04362.1 30S ribosomal protein S8 [Bacteroidetes bacterium SB0662_bin_6]
MSGITDPVSDYLTRIRNGQQAGRKYVDIPASKQKRAITQILLDKGYIRSYLNVDDGKQGLIRIRLKYDAQGEPVIRMMKRVSTPGLRRYTRANELPRVMNGLGIAILSTSRGMMTDKEARKAHIGGEVLAYLY